MTTSGKKRIIEIDLLRGVAVILVLFRHFHNPDYSVKIPYLEKAGWMGVDLFFVISGFLISAILFKEMDKRGTIDFKRFFIRRGFKIYPAFYALIIFTIGYKLFSGIQIHWNQVIHEVIFIQSYATGLLVHTWSLGVEEHFYILLPLLLLLLVRLGKGAIGQNRAIPLIYLVIAMVCLGYRLILSLNEPFEIYRNVFYSHARFDSLFWGVFLSYCYRYHRPSLEQFIAQWKYPLLVVGVIFASLPFFIDFYDFFMYTIGFTLISWGFGIILIILLTAGPAVKYQLNHSPIWRPLSTIGYYSYSVYLWHIPVEGIINRLGLYEKMPAFPLFILFVAACFLAGYLMARIIEFPALRIRDRLFPAYA